MTQAPPAPPVTLKQRKAIDLVCDQFERAWKDGLEPRIEDFAERVPATEREVVLWELLAIELDYRRRRNEPILPADYVKRFPHWNLVDVQSLTGAKSGDLPKQRIDVAEPSTVSIPAAPPTSSRYSILKMHARGGMGEIWLADDLEIGRRVAYKRVRPGREPIRERFLTEAQITGQLEHPGIVPVHDLGRDADGNPFYVMRLVRGRTLKEVIAAAQEEMARQPKSRELHWVKLLEIYLALCRTVDYVHHHGVIHRDIKPDNVMIGDHGETLVIDWGLAKRLDVAELSASKQVSVVRPSGSSGSTSTQDGNVLGSPQYISPEMAEGRIADGDVKNDVYLLGATLYEILTGKPPRQGSSHDELIQLARTTPPKPPRQLNPHAPAALEAICLHAMARNREGRYETAREIAVEVERYLAGEQVRAYAEPWTDRVGRWMRRHRRALLRSSAAVILVALTAVAAVGWRRADARATAAAAALAKERQLDQARQDDDQLHRLAEKLHYVLADTTPLDERLSFTEPGEAERLRGQIDEIAARWSPDLAGFPLDERRAPLQRLLAELALWQVQSAIAQPTTAERAKTLVEELNRIAGLNPPAKSYYRLRARCHYLAGQPELAEEAIKLSRQAKAAAFDHFLQGEEHRTAAIGRRGDADEPSLWRSDRQQLLEAAADYERCLQLDANHPWARLQKSRCHLVRDEIDAALAELNLVVSLKSQSPWGWSVRGLAHAVLRNYPQAQRDLDQALRLNPDFAAAQLHRGAVLLLRGQTELAKEVFAEVGRRHPGNVHARYYLASAEFQARNFPAALKECSAILESHPQQTAPRLLRVQIHLSQNNADQAKADLNHWLALQDSTLDVNSPEAAARRCRHWRLLAARAGGEPQKLALELAIRDGSAAVEKGLKSANLHDDLAAVYVKQKRPADALAQIGLGLECEASPLLLAKLRSKRGLQLTDRASNEEQLAQAKEDYLAASRVPGNETEAQLVRAQAHAMLGYVAALKSQPAEAQRETALAVAELRGATHYTLWINLACTYNALADNQPRGDPELQDTAMALLRSALFQAERVGARPNAVLHIRSDDALKSLQRRPDFAELLANS